MTRPYKGIKLNVYRYLQEQPLARERSNRYRTIANLLQRRYPELEKIDKGFLALITKYAIDSDRYIRKVQEEKPDTRGSDYLLTKKSSQINKLKEINN